MTNTEAPKEQTTTAKWTFLGKEHVSTSFSQLHLVSFEDMKAKIDDITVIHYLEDGQPMTFVVNSCTLKIDPNFKIEFIPTQ
jgi:hypothetical protein